MNEIKIYSKLGNVNYSAADELSQKNVKNVVQIGFFLSGDVIETDLQEKKFKVSIIFDRIVFIF